MSFVDQALSLINKTEANLRRIDAFGEDFATPSLNEWRYAIRHVVTAAGKSGDAAQDWGKAIGHIKRAYFDSCDILLDCQLKVLIETNRRYRGHADQVAKILPDYPKWIGTIRRAQELHGKVDLESDNREAAYDSLAPVIDELQDIINKLADCADEIEASIRRAKVIFWLTVVAALATIAGFLFPVMFKIASMLLR